MGKKVPKLYQGKENCCGCGACFAICPVSAISMSPDEEGFLYPKIDQEVCIGCLKCTQICAFKSDQNASVGGI